MSNSEEKKTLLCGCARSSTVSKESLGVVLAHPNHQQQWRVKVKCILRNTFCVVLARPNHQHWQIKVKYILRNTFCVVLAHPNHHQQWRVKVSIANFSTAIRGSIDSNYNHQFFNFFLHWNQGHKSLTLIVFWQKP